MPLHSSSSSLPIPHPQQEKAVCSIYNQDLSCLPARKRKGSIVQILHTDSQYPCTKVRAPKLTDCCQQHLISQVYTTPQCLAQHKISIKQKLPVSHFQRQSFFSNKKMNTTSKFTTRCDLKVSSWNRKWDYSVCELLSTPCMLSFPWSNTISFSNLLTSVRKERGK